MKRVRITLDPAGEYRPPVYDLMTREATYLQRVQLVNWNVASPPAAFLLRLRGEYRRFADELADHGTVDDHDVLPVTDRKCYCFLTGETGPPARALFENFTQGSLMTVPPVECHDDGSSTFTLVGTGTDIQAAVDGLPDGVGVRVETVGGEHVADEGVVGRLSARQREAVETALELGYYDQPRDATTEDVARALGCATATAAEHLRKAEATLVETLWSER